MELNNRAKENELFGMGPFKLKPADASYAMLNYFQHNASENDLMRSLVSDRKWFAPLDLFTDEGKPTRSFDEMLVLTPDRLTMGDEVWIFTSEESARKAHPHRPFLGTFVGGISGTELFSAIPLKTKTIRINPHSPVAFSLTLHESDGGISKVKEWAAMVRREDSYEQWQQTGEPDKVDFNSHDFWVFNHIAAPIITLPKHSGMSNPVAAFSAPDCAAMFLSKLDPQVRGAMREAKESGRTLLEKRQIDMGIDGCIDGVIINPYGPGTTYALPFALLNPASSPANLIKDAFAILYFLADADGSVDQRELQIIVDFTNRQHGQLNFDPRQTIMDLAALTGDARIKAYDRAIFDFKDHSSVDDRYTLMHFAADLAMADGSITDHEKILFQDMAEVWGIDTQALFQQSKSFVASTAAPPAALPADKSSRKTEQGNFFAWSLGSSLSLYALAEASLNSGLAAKHFEKAQMAAGGMGLYINPLTGMTSDVGSNQISTLVYLLNQEGLRLANEMETKHDAAASAYFYIIVKTYNLLLMFSPETNLEGILSLKPRTVIPDEFFQPLTSALRQSVKYEALKPTIFEFDRAVSVFLQNRINGEKNSVEQNVFRENNQTNEFKSAPQTAAATPNSSETLSAPLQILSAYGQGRAGNDEVLRSLISHQGWFAPLEMFYREGEKKIRIERGVSTDERHIKAGELWLFTDYESVIRAVDVGASIGSYGGTISGTELFGNIPSDIKSISVNPHSPREKTWSFFDETSVELARLWSEVIALEEKIEQWQPDKPDLTALGDYRGFITFVNAATNGIFLMKEFSEEMRIAAPVFTAPDSADKFLKNLPPEKSAELKQITINGHTLLSDLPNIKIEMPNNQPPARFDGAVINVFGPGAFYTLRFSDIIHGT